MFAVSCQSGRFYRSMSRTVDSFEEAKRIARELQERGYTAWIEALRQEPASPYLPLDEASTVRVVAVSVPTL